MAKIIVLGAMKGGVGKSVSTFNLAYSLAELGKKVLAVDFDSQANLTTCMGVEDVAAVPVTIGHLMMNQIEEEEQPEPEEYIMNRNGVDFIPSSMVLSAVDAKLRIEMGAERILAGILEPLRDRYDYILIDTCPSLGALTINALAAADEVIIAANPQLLAMMGLQDFLKSVRKIKNRINPKLEVAGILLTMCVARTNLCKVITEQVSETFAGQLRIFDSKIPNTVKVGESVYYSEPLLEYKEVEAAFRKKVSAGAEKENEEEEGIFPEYLKKGHVFPEIQAACKECFTAPPKPFCEDTLLAAMETAGNKDFEKETEKKGLGTPATRAAIIEKLVSSHYAVRKGKQILPTMEGRELVSILPEQLKSAAMTAQWENELLAVEKGKADSERFMEGIIKLLEEILADCRSISSEERRQFQDKEVIGICPVCQSPVYEGKHNFYCDSRDCSFALWKENRFLAGRRKKMDKRMAAELLKEGRVFVKDLYSVKKDRYFNAYLIMGTKDGKAEFHLEFPKGKSKRE